MVERDNNNNNNNNNNSNNNNNQLLRRVFSECTEAIVTSLIPHSYQFS